MEKHTPTPWVKINPKPYGVQITSENGFISKISNGNKSNEQNLANAEFIVKAVNCHDELVEALKTISEQCGTFATKQPALDYASIGNIARQALAKAEKN